MALLVKGIVFCCYILFGLCVNGKHLYAKSSHGDEATCGYSSCNPVKDGMINAHIVPHTHDDVGWIITVDQYYYTRVQYILDSVIPELVKDPMKRFIYVEIAFFERWYREQNADMRQTVQKLVAQGRLEFILGGWCMNDEAATHYNAIIDQHTLGFEFLRQNFGKCGRPRIAWQIDPFGHSREQASIFARFGFDSLFVGRIDYQDHEYRALRKTMEMIWRGSPDNLGTPADLFTGVLPNLYQPPRGFCFDIFCNDGPIVDDKRLHDVNVEKMVEEFLEVVEHQAQDYATNHLIFTMGSDFQYQAAHNWYLNLDKLIKYVNAKQANGSKVNLLYSTPSCYTYHLHRANKTWTTKEDDFFPYAHRPHSFWTGYFTSRPSLKGYVRQTNNFLQAVKQLDALAMLKDTDNSTRNINVLAQAMGVLQHHDAVAGTERQAVTYDYEERLANGVTEAQKVFNDAVNKLEGHTHGSKVDHRFCTLLNISVCSLTEKENKFMVTVYNPVGRKGLYYVRIPLSTVGVQYKVYGPDGNEVSSEVVPISQNTFQIPERRGDPSKYELVFPVNLTPLGFSVFTVTRINGSEGNALLKAVPFRGVADQHDNQPVGMMDAHEEERVYASVASNRVLQNEYLSIYFDWKTGGLKRMTNLKKNISIELFQKFTYYYGSAGNNSKPKFQASGAYIFRPNGSAPFDMDLAKPTFKNYYVKGELVQEIYQEFTTGISQSIRLYSNQPYVELQWTVGPIPVHDGRGKEVVNQLITDLHNKGIFYTDANGREILMRKRNHRDTWKFNNTEPISGNYYPVNSRIYIRDEAKNIQFTVLTDRSEGGTSLYDGQIELMVHRRLLYDDNLGVNQPLNETGCDGKGLVVRGSHYLMLEPIDSAAAGHRDLAERLFMAPQISFSVPTDKSSASTVKSWSGLRKPLPDNVHLLTLEQYPSHGPVPSDSQPFLLRLEHFYEKGEDSVLSKPVTLNLKKMFSTFDIVNATELTLGGNMALSEMNRLKWKYTNHTDHKMGAALRFQSEKGHDISNSDPLSVTLNPMEIKTFQINIKALNP